MLISFAAVVTLLDSPGQTPTQTKWQNKNEASAFLFFLFTFCHWISEAVCALLKKWVEFTTKQTKTIKKLITECSHQTLDFLEKKIPKFSCSCDWTELSTVIFVDC